MSIRRNLVHGLKWSAAGRVLSQAVSWGITILVIRMLAPSDYGLMAMATAVISLLAYLNDLGLGSAIVQAREINARQCGAIFGLQLILGAAMAGMIALLAPLFAWLLDDPRLTSLLSVVGLTFIISALSAVPEALLRREMDFRTLAKADILNVFLGGMTTLVLAWSGFGVWALATGYLCGNFVRMIALNAIARHRIRPNLRFKDCPSNLKFGGYLTASRLAWWLMSQADILICGKVLGREALGVYSVALNLASLPLHKTMAVVNQVAFSAVAKAQDHSGAVRRGVLEGIGWLGYIVFPALVGLSVTAPLIIPPLLGDEWAGAVQPLQLIALAAPVRMLSIVLSTAVTALGRADVDFRNTLTGALIMPFCFFVGVQWGVVGLASSWVIAVPVVFALNFRRVSAAIGISARELFGVLAKPAASTAAMASGVVLWGHALTEQLGPSVGVWVVVVGAAILYLGAALLIDSRLRRAALDGVFPYLH